MRIIDLAQLDARPVDRFDSTGFSVAGLARGTETHSAVLTLEPDGVIGRHPAVGRQILVLLRGDARVSGADGAPHDLIPGQAVVWEPDEQHETRTTLGMTALVIEGDVTLT